MLDEMWKFTEVIFALSSTLVMSLPSCRIINNFGKAGAVIFNALLCRLFCKISPFKAVRQVPNCL